MKFEKFKKINISELNYPKDGMFSIYANFWWITTKDDEILFYLGKSPQCNVSKNIVEHLTKGSPFVENECKITQIPFVYIPMTCYDYDYKL